MKKYRQHVIATALSILGILFPFPVKGQVPVSMAPVTKFQFFSNAGFPLSSGCVFTFQAGTSTPAITYRDSAGTIANANPIILDGGGRADIWLPNAAYKFTLKSAGGVNCASGSTLWTVDGISGVLGLLNLNNVWTGTNQFNQPIVINVNANQIVAGTIGNRTTLNFPEPAGNITLNTPSISDTLLGQISPIMATPTINGVKITGSPATYTSFSNDTVTGTTINTLTKMNGALAIKSSAGDSGGVVGVTVAGAGIAGIATVQQNGQVSCVFDNATTSGDYVQISITTAGNCHDAGAAYPTSGQIIGRAGVTAGAGTNSLLLFGPEIKPVSQITMTTGAYSNATTVMTDVTNLAFPVLANTNYVVDCNIYFLSSATTAGPKFQFTGPAAPTAVNIGVDGPNSNAALGGYTAAFSSGVAIMGTVNASLLNFTAHVFMALQNGANAGTVSLQAAANGAGTLTIVRPSVCIMRIQ